MRLLAVLVVVAAAAVLPSAAAAQAPVCPSAPPAYSGTDDAAAQVNAMRADLAETCAVAHDDAAKLLTRLGQTLTVECSNCTQPASGPAGSDSDPAYVRLASSDETRPLIEEAANTMHSNVWFAIGLMAGLLAGYGLLRQVMPR